VPHLGRPFSLSSSQQKKAARKVSGGYRTRGVGTCVLFFLLSYAFYTSRRRQRNCVPLLFAFFSFFPPFFFGVIKESAEGAAAADHRALYGVPLPPLPFSFFFFFPLEKFGESRDDRTSGVGYVVPVSS